MAEYKSHRIIDGRPKLVIVNENGKVTNENLSENSRRDDRNIPISYRNIWWKIQRGKYDRI